MADTILIVDDEPYLRTLLTHFLAREGFTTLTAASGEEALDRSKTEEIDLVLLDVGLPRMDGFETARMMRNGMRMQDVPIIFLTAKEDTLDKRRGFELGADDYILKPFDRDELLARVQSRLRHRKGELDHRIEDRSETLSQLMVTLAHYINNALAAMYGRAQITDETNPKQALVLKDLVLFQCRKIEEVIASIQEMEQQRSLATTAYAGVADAMLDIKERLESRLEQIDKEEGEKLKE